MSSKEASMVPEYIVFTFFEGKVYVGGQQFATKAVTPTGVLEEFLNAKGQLGFRIQGGLNPTSVEGKSFGILMK
jgi:hypothetical protein